MGIVASARVRLAWPLAAAVPAGGYYHAYGDGGDGSIDYATPINAMPIPARPDLANLAGYGWGGGNWGRGGWGHGGALLRFDTDLLADARHKLAVVPHDQADNPADPPHVEAEIAVAGTPQPPRRLAASTYAGGVLAMTFTRSDDDED